MITTAESDFPLVLFFLIIAINSKGNGENLCLIVYFYSVATSKKCI